MAVVVVDTDLLIDWLRDRRPAADRVESWLRSGALYTTAITAFELRLGHDFVEREPNILRVLVGRTLDFDLLSALRAGEVHRHLAASGTPIGVADTLQAGTCLRYGLPLATGNRRHFERVPDLELVDWD